ncbi:glutamate receptor 1-like [Linepithema humile]|uniref:glutamate receptor 1-like n=1 Tax=Linepithema humile TaxID=83485 RepID=UPI00351DED7D
MPLFVVLLDTREAMSEFAKATRNIKPISFPTWFVMFLQHPGNPLEKYCEHPTDNVFNVDFSTLMLVLCYDHPILVEWYAIRDNHTRTFELATWTADKGLILRTQKSLYARRNNMFGDVMRVAYVDDSPFFTMRNGKINGFLGLLMVELSKVMNFTMKILNPVKAYGSWSYTQNIWTGAIGQLVFDEADIGVSEFTITSGRLNVVDFTLPLMLSRNCLYFKEPSGSDVPWSGYFKAFSSDIWITLVVIIITASILLTIIKAKGFSINVISESYINVWGIYCQQGLSEFPNKSSMRLAFFSIHISSLIIMAAYSASLISFLTLTTTSLPFSTMESYVKDGSYKLIVMRNSAEYDMRTSTYLKDPVFRKMYDLMVKKEQLPLTLSDGFKQLCGQKKYAFYTTEVFRNALNIYVPCKVLQIESGKSDSLALALRKGNPYIGLINYYLQQFQDNGVMRKLRDGYLLRDNPSVTRYDAVNLKDIALTLTVVTGGPTPHCRLSSGRMEWKGKEKEKSWCTVACLFNVDMITSRIWQTHSVLLTAQEHIVRSSCKPSPRVVHAHEWRDKEVQLRKINLPKKSKKN